MKLRCISAVTWLVYAVLIEEKQVLLEVYRRDLGTLKSSSHGNVSIIGLRTALVAEKKLVSVLELTGAIVWREGDREMTLTRPLTLFLSPPTNKTANTH